MKKTFLLQFLFFIGFLFACVHTNAQKPENWTQDELIEPSTLAATLDAKKDIPVIISVGPGAVIPHSIDMGMASDSANLQRLKEGISKLPKSTNIVVYCGCCPFEKCPNVRPAIALLKEMNFTNYHLLNVPHNIKTDWISKGYPVMEEAK
jgi:hypothetical protein